ncbi:MULTISPECIES: efflux RND transporter periplasmic adaptor subunit [Actibacterium]|uniref:Membrane fusion protein (Multidrug efflux system) n=1 Tax=Actibacterium naphthalenivorans TaxID=1614693 RepID=A0A840CBI0_9RHOB|nr:MULTISPECIES: efflux RND transporter periplasmic adaptor subunit [Actibacterium]ALG89624.1 hemolysin D [Actibacterium sp. EMB200-NS6]MBB4020709.1 membrane fusion protein (multidrug efflux system) [Actibacterium naphthalenivorans]
MVPSRSALKSIVLAASLLSGIPAGVALGQEDRPPTPVTVVTLAEQDVTLTSILPGRVVASGVAEVRPQVAGIITERLFEEGSFVTQGDELYRIDPASYEAQVAAATAAVAQAEATLSSAQKESDRMQALLERRVVSQQNLDDANAIRDAAAAALQVAQAQLLAANIDLDRTTIRAPLTGEVGRSLTTRGALVTAGQAGALAVIRQLDPVYVDVTQSAAELIRWRRGETQAELGNANRTVVLTLADGEPYEFTGELTAAEPHVDEQTGVVVLRLEFPNPDELLLPGMYVQVEMPQGVIANAVLAPQDGVTRDRRGRPIALVVNEQNVIEERTLTVVRNIGSDWIVSAGLEDGDRIIVEGLQMVGVGMTVVPEERQPTQTQTEN